MASVTETFARERADIDQRMAAFIDHYERNGREQLNRIIDLCTQLERQQLGALSNVATFCRLAVREIRCRVVERELEVLREKRP